MTQWRNCERNDYITSNSLIFILFYSMFASVTSKLVGLASSSYIILPSSLSLMTFLIPRRRKLLRIAICTVTLVLTTQEILFQNYSLSLADAKYFGTADMISISAKPVFVMTTGYYLSLLCTSYIEYLFYRFRKRGPQ